MVSKLCKLLAQLLPPPVAVLVFVCAAAVISFHKTAVNHSSVATVYRSARVLD